MKFIKDRSEQSILPLIVEWVGEGVEIWSDKWKAYHSIKDGIKFMEEVKDEDGKLCSKTWSIRGNSKSWLFNSKLKLREIILALYGFAAQFTVKQLKILGLKWSPNTFTDYNNMFRQICTEEYYKFTKKMEGAVAMMDESLFSKNFVVTKQCAIIHHAII